MSNASNVNSSPIPQHEECVHNEATIHHGAVEEPPHVGLQILWIASVWQHTENANVH